MLFALFTTEDDCLAVPNNNDWRIKMAIDLTVPIYTLLVITLLGLSLLSYLSALILKRVVNKLAASTAAEKAERAPQGVATGTRVPAVSGGA